MKKRNVVIWGIFFLLLLLMVFWNFFSAKELKSNGILLNSKIIDISSNAKGTRSFKCEYSYQTEKMIGTSTSKVKKIGLFIGKHFPLVYSPKIDIIQILITPEDFHEYNLPFPDSLNWVLKYRY